MLWVDLWPRWIVREGARRALDLVQAQALLALQGIPRREWRGICNDLLEMEDEALNALYAK